MMTYFYIELFVWLGTMYLCALAYCALARRYHDINPYKAAVPMGVSRFMSRLALTNAINYLGFALLGTILAFNLPENAAAVINDWFIVEIFIFWNIRTAALIFMGLRNTKVEI